MKVSLTCAEAIPTIIIEKNPNKYSHVNFYLNPICLLSFLFYVYCIEEVNFFAGLNVLTRTVLCLDFN